MDNFIALLILGSSIWVFFDARSIGVRKGLVTGLADMNPWMWLVACLLLWIISFPVYLIKRGDFKKAIAQNNRKTSSGMVFCRGCGKSIHSSAETCPQCGAKQ